MQTFLIIGLVISLVGMFTTKPVSGWLAPKGPGFWAIPRTLISMMWFTVGGLFCLIGALAFGLGLALLH